MSGHSKWHNIRVKKMATDARKGKAYTKYARLVEIAAREGGGDPMTNVRLRSLIDAAKQESVPNANIDRAIKKGTGALKGEAMQEMTYEAYGPGGAAFIIECLTDNKNRTLSNVKLILSKTGGRFAESGSVMWMFERKGVVTAQSAKLKMDSPSPAIRPRAHGREAGYGGAGNPTSAAAFAETSGTLEKLELQLIDLGAEDFDVEGETIHVTMDSTKWAAVRDFLKSQGFTVDSADLEYVAKQTAPVDAATMEKVGALVDALEEDEDVSAVSTNAVVA